MKKALIISVTLLIATTLLSAAFLFQRIDYRKGINKNVCKSLNGDVLIYAIFADTKYTAPWTEFDIRSTMDSIAVAVNWINKQAKDNNITLIIKTDHFIGDDYATIKKDLPEESILKTITTPNTKIGFENINSWADYIARKAGASTNIPEKDGIPEIKKPKNKERLIALLRDEFQVESVALLIMVNNYYKYDISIPVNYMESDDVEFAVVSYKYPSEIAHNFLHMFGASDLYETPYRKFDKNIEFADKEFPNDIMQNPYGKNISDCEIGDFTKYLIGWNSNLDEKYHPLLFDKRVRIK